MMKYKSYSDTHRAGPGASTVLLILLVTCLALLGALSLSVARNDLEVTNRAIEAETDFYLAQAAAAYALAEADEALADMRRNFPEASRWRSALEEMDGYEAETGLITLRIPVDEYRLVRIVLKPLAHDSQMRFEVIEHRICMQDDTGGTYDQF